MAQSIVFSTFFLKRTTIFNKFSHFQETKVEPYQAIFDTNIQPLLTSMKKMLHPYIEFIMRNTFHPQTQILI